MFIRIRILLMASLVLIFILTACAAGAVPGSDAVRSSQQPEVIPQSSDVVILETEKTADPAEVIALDPGISVRVLWTVSGYIIGQGSTTKDEDAKAYLFKPLDITDTQVIFDRQVCNGVTFQEETVSAVDYLSDTWKVTQKTLGIDFQELQVIKTNCSLFGFQEYMRLGDRRLIVPFEGVFYFLDPAVAY